MGFLNGQVMGLFYHFSALKSWASSHLKITKPISKLRVLFFFWFLYYTRGLLPPEERYNLSVYI